MGYVVRHSTSNINKTRRRGKVVIGTDSGGYDKTSSSGLYNGVPPVEGKHNIVRVQSSGDPDFYVLDDIEIVNFSNQLGGSVTTVLEAKNYLLSRDDIAFTDDIKNDNIVTDGLVLSLNAGVKSSFLDNEPITNILDGGENRIKGITGAFVQGNHAGANSAEYVNQYYSEARPDVIRIKTTNSTGYAMINQRMSSNAVSGSTYSYSFDYKQLAYDGTWTPTAGVYGDGYKVPNSSYTNVNTSYQYISLPDGWTRFIMTYDATYAGRNTFRSNMNTNNNANLDILFDNFQIEEGIGTTFTTSSRSQNTTWYDLSGEGNNAVLTNSPTFENNTITFDGTNDYATISSDSSFNVNTRTVELTFKMNGSYSNFTPLAVYANGSSTSNRVWLGLQNSKFQMHGWGTTDPAATTTISADRWYTCVWSYDKGIQKMKMYTNGVLENDHSQTQGGVNGASGNNWYLAYIPGSWQSQTYAATSISSFKIYDKVLSNSEVSQNYYGGPIVTENLQLCVDAGNLVSYENGSTITYDMVKGDEGDGYGSYDGSGTLYNGVLFDDMNGGTWDFDGTNDYISFGTQAFQYQYDDNFSLEVWCNPDALSGFKHLIGVTYASYRLAHSGTTISFRLDANTIATSGGTLTVGEWSHVIATWDSTTQTAKVYKNGELATSVTNTNCNWTSQGTDFRIASSPGENYYFNGKIPIGRVYNKTLSASEVLQNYNAQKARFI